MGWNEASNLSLSRDNHSATRPSLYSLRPFRDTFLRGTCLQPPRTGGRGFAHTALSVFAYKGRHHGCSRWIRTTSQGYEPCELPLLHHCDINQGAIHTNYFPKNMLCIIAVSTPLLVQNAGIEPFPRFPKPVCKTITLHSGCVGNL